VKSQFTLERFKDLVDCPCAATGGIALELCDGTNLQIGNCGGLPKYLAPVLWGARLLRLFEGRIDR
jgi:hypothetical protein